MPVVVITPQEIIYSALVETRRRRDEFLALADLEKKPLDPGESVAARHHKLAKLGKQLAEAFTLLDAGMIQMQELHAAAHEDQQPAPAAEPAKKETN